MAKLTAQELAEKWARKFGASGQDYMKGVMQPKKSPMQAAIAQKAVMKENWLKSVDDGVWERNLGAITVPRWTQACVEKGAPKLMAAAKMAQERVAAAERTFGPIRDSIVNSLPPRGDINANIERAAEFARRMHAASGRTGFANAQG